MINYFMMVAIIITMQIVVELEHSSFKLIQKKKMIREINYEGYYFFKLN